MINPYDIIGGITGMTGGLFIMHKNKLGYIAFGISNIAFAILGIAQHNYGLIAVSLFNLIIDCVAYRKWFKEERNDKIRWGK